MKDWGGGWDDDGTFAYSIARYFERFLVDELTRLQAGRNPCPGT